MERMPRRYFSFQHPTRGFEAEAAFAALLNRDFAPVETAAEAGYDFRTTDGRYVIEFKRSLLSARDLHEALLKLVFVLDEHPDIERGVLITHFPRMSQARLHSEWERLQRLLLPSVARRLGLVAVGADGDLAVPELLDQRRLLAIARETFPREVPTSPVRLTAPQWSAKTFTVWKVLLDAWLRSEELLPVQEIVRRSGCSRPTVNAAFNLLERRKELVRGKNRRGGFAEMPRASLREVLTLSKELRLTSPFIDRSGRKPDPVSLLRRINEKKSAGVAVGGVVAARFYQPNFDLNGLPRVDLTVRGDHSLSWLSAVDPALRSAFDQAESDEHMPVLVVHTLPTSTNSLFDPGPPGSLPLAGPAETLLDLYELRLVEQAEEFVRHLRSQKIVAQLG